MKRYSKFFFEGGFGIERETLRLNKNKRLSQTPHPFEDPHIERDFCENQLEIITSVHSSVTAAIKELKTLDQFTCGILRKKGEFLWKYSNPPHFEDESEIPIAKYSEEKIAKHIYRKKLEEKYGKRLMLYSGIHFNFSLSEEYLKEQLNGNEGFSDYKNKIYFRLMKQAFRYSWLLVLLTAASPLYDKSLEGNGKTGTGFKGLGSMRNSACGYWNQFIPVLDYSDLESFSKGIAYYVQSGQLISPAELYLPVRLKPKGKNNLDTLITNGVDHIELRMFDLNPLSPIGIFTEDLEFAHLLLLYLLSLPDFEFTPSLQEKAIINHKSAAKYDIDQITIDGCSARQAAIDILNDMSCYYSGFEQAEKIIDMQKEKIVENHRYCVKIYEQYQEGEDRKCANFLVPAFGEKCV